MLMMNTTHMISFIWLMVTTVLEGNRYRSFPRICYEDAIVHVYIGYSSGYLGGWAEPGRFRAFRRDVQQLLDFCTINGAKAVGLADRIGSIEPGKYADLIILDGKAPNLRPPLPENPVSNPAYSSNGLNVKTVLCQGDLVIQDRKLTLDEECVLQTSEEHWRKPCLR